MIASGVASTRRSRSSQNVLASGSCIMLLRGAGGSIPKGPVYEVGARPVGPSRSGTKADDRCLRLRPGRADRPARPRRAASAAGLRLPRRPRARALWRSAVRGGRGAHAAARAALRAGRCARRARLQYGDRGRAANAAAGLAPTSGHAGRNVVGIVAPTVEAATQTPWAVATPQYPQKNNRDVIAVFGTTRTIALGVYSEEIFKRCPRATVLAQSCPELAAAIEAASPRAALAAIVAGAVDAMTSAARLPQARSGDSRLHPFLAASRRCSPRGCRRARVCSPSPRSWPTASKIISRGIPITRRRASAACGSSRPVIRITCREAAAVFWPGVGRFERLDHDQAPR